MTWVVAGVIKSDKDAVDVPEEWETKLLNEAHLTQKAGKRWDISPIKRNSDSAWEKSCSSSLEHGEDDVAVMMALPLKTITAGCMGATTVRISLGSGTCCRFLSTFLLRSNGRLRST
jgi:hypothetical protein